MANILEKYEKQPGETEDFDISFAEYLARRGDTGASFTVEVGTGITVESSSLIDGVVKVFLSGGTDGATYKVTAKLVTSNGREKHGEIEVKVKEI